MNRRLLGLESGKIYAKITDIFSVKFHVTSSKQNADGLLVEIHDQFFMNNGPPTWQQISFLYKPHWYVRNPLCPSNINALYLSGARLLNAIHQEKPAIHFATQPIDEGYPLDGHTYLMVVN